MADPETPLLPPEEAAVKSAPTRPSGPPRRAGLADADLLELPRQSFDFPETSDGGLFGAQFEKDAIENNYWWAFERRRREIADGMLADMAEQIYGAVPPTLDSAAPRPEGYPLPGQFEMDRLAAVAALFDQARAMRESNPGSGELANFPFDFKDLEEQAGASAKRDLSEELTAADLALLNRSDPNVMGGLASFSGSMVAGVTDVEGVALLPFGAGQKSLARTILIESFLGGGGAALQVPAQQKQADRLGSTAPDPVTQILSGFAFGGALPIAGRALKMGVNALTPAGRTTNADLIKWGTRPDASPAERAAATRLSTEEAARSTAPPGVDPDIHSAKLARAARDLEDDAPDMVRAEDVIPGTDVRATGIAGTSVEPPTFGYQPGGNAAPDTNLVGYVTGKLIDRGMDPHHAMAFVGNGMVESGKGLNSGAIGDNGNAYGIWQWNGPRRHALMKFAGDKGADWRDVDTQIDFLFYELNGPEYAAWQRIQGADDAAEAARLVSELFERPGVPHLSSRMAYARMLADQYAQGQVPKGGSPGRWRDPGDDARATDVMSFDPRDLQTDAAGYQFKMGGDQFGVTGRLTGEREWDAAAAVGVMVHERIDGSRFIADGHQRLGLARRFLDEGTEGITLQGFLYREADGWTVEDIRARAALKNIRQESGTPLDAAKILRNNPELASQMGSRSRPFMLQAQGLADLSPSAFQAVVNEVVPQNYGALVGRLIPEDDRLQIVALAALKKTAPANETQAESVVRDIRRLGLKKQADEAQMDLFDAGFDLKHTVISERMKITDAVVKTARADRAIFARLEKEADTIQEAGNVLNRTANVTRAEAAERILSRFLILASQDGPVRNAVDAAARNLRAGGKLDDAVASVTSLLGTGNRPDGAGLGMDGSGGSGVAPAALTPTNLLDLPAEGGARLEPGLFDDPVTDRVEIARLDTMEREVTGLLVDPAFDPDITIELDLFGDGPVRLPLREAMGRLAEETGFVDSLQTLCMKKG